MSNYIIERQTESGTIQTECRNMREAGILFDLLKDHVDTLHTQVIVYGKVTRTHKSEKSVLTPLQNIKRTQNI